MVERVRVPRIAVAWLVLMGGLAMAPSHGFPVAQAAPGDLTVPDGSGDVSVGQANSPAVAASPGLDITEISLGGQTGEFVLARVKLADMKAEGSAVAGPPAGLYATATGGVYVQACWTWNGVLFAARVHYIMNTVPLVSETKLGVVAACAPDTALVFQSGKVRDRFGVQVDVVTSTVTFVLQRIMLAEIAGASPPKAGEALKDFRAVVTDGKRDRIDAAPNTAPASEALTFTSDTANTGLRAFPDKNVLAFLGCNGRRDLPTYAIQAGGKRGIPIVLENPGAARDVALSVDTLAGTDWKPRMMPKIHLPAGADGQSGNVTVNVIVDTPAGTKHKECSTIRVRAIDSGTPGDFGETSVNVVAVDPPGPQQRKLFMHANEFAANTCSGSDVWLNTLEADPDDSSPPKDILLNNCRDATPVSLASASINPRIDVNPSHDLVVNTSAAGKMATATVLLRSDGAPTRARITVVVVTGVLQFDTVGEGFTDVTIATTPTAVAVQMPISFTRDSVATGDPSRTLDARDGVGMSIRYAPLPADANVPGATVAGRVSLLPKGTFMELPIFAAIKRNVNDPGERGGLLSLSADGVLPQFASPGAVRLFNFTVLNEGATTDAAVASAVAAGASGWTTKVYPEGPYVLAPGERRAFQVGITPPADAAESSNVLLDVTVVSQSDATARASISVKVVSTRENSVPVERAPDLVGTGKHKGLMPGFEGGLVFAAILLVGAAARRRRD